VDTTLQVMALGVARWLLVPTKADASSIRGLQRVAERVVDAGTTGHRVDVLGLVLTGVPTAATRVRARPPPRRHHYRAGRHPPCSAWWSAAATTWHGSAEPGAPLAQELAEQLEGVEPFWRAFREGHTPIGCPAAPPLWPMTRSGSPNRSCCG
jgi:chromosome partitioning protein